VPPVTPTRRAWATSESTRARRFALPDLEDERTGESIQAFLDGPDVRRRRPASRQAAAASVTIDGPRSAAGATVALRLARPARPATDLRTIPGRLEWNAALARESVRSARYGRPAAVAIVELKPDRPNADVEPWLRSLAGPIARALRHDSRATDLVARMASRRFQILLPETDEAGAARLGERVAAACKTFIEGTGAPVVVRVSVAGTSLTDTLDDALAHALRAIEAA